MKTLKEHKILFVILGLVISVITVISVTFSRKTKFDSDYRDYNKEGRFIDTIQSKQNTGKQNIDKQSADETKKLEIKDNLTSYERLRDKTKSLGIKTRKSYKLFYKNGKYNEKGTYEKTEFYYQNGNQISEEGSAGAADMNKIFKYDYTGRLTETVQINKFFQNWKNGYETATYKDEYEYNKSGVLVKIVTYTEGSFDIQTEYKYDDNKNVIEVIQRNAKNQVMTEKYRSYNPQGFVKEDLWVNHLFKKKYDADKGKTIFIYDRDGKLFETICYYGEEIKFKFQYHYEYY